MQVSVNGSVPNVFADLKPKNPKSVMIIEDDQIVARLLSRTLAKHGFHIRIALDGQIASESIKSQPPPKIVLLDISLPFFDGFEILNRIRSQKGWEKVPVIMVTSKTHEQNIVRAFECGATDYITKPFQINELMARINRFIS